MEGSVSWSSYDIENQYDQLETSIKKELDSLSLLSPLRCIYRVPDRLRRESEVAYTPRVISIGPFHHKNKTLEAMEDHKKRYLRRFTSRYNLQLKDYIRKIKEQEEKLRSCYPESIGFSSDDFVKIILVDAIFVIEFLLTYSDFVSPDDCMFEKPLMKNDIIPDLLMLENQLPFFILKDIFDPNIFRVSSECFHRPDHFVERLSVRFLEDVNVVGDGAFGRMSSSDDLLKKISSSEEEVQHFVDLLRRLWMSPLSNEPSATLFVTKKVHSPRLVKQKKAPSIEKLHLAGVKFEVELTKNLFDIRFDKGTLKIPKLLTGDSTEIILRNLIAFEQCSTSDNYCISDYLIMMDELVDTPKDVELLVKYGIIENDLGGGDQELSSLINSLSTGIIYNSTNFYYGDLCGKLDKFHSSKWHKRMAILRRNYFNTPWATISFVAAVVLLILTAIQTICSIISLK